MNYQHYFHAGNFADIFKHSILCFCLEKLHEKPTSFMAIDTHSSSAKYSIFDEKIVKTNEFNEGLRAILDQPNFQEILPQKFLEILAKINVCEIQELPSKLNYYAGSPLIIKNFLRFDDKAIFAENNQPIFQELRKNFVGNKKISCLQENGFDLLKSKLPPREKRAIILIDPAYEKNHNLISNDYRDALNSLQDGHRRFANGIYLLWYPIIEGDEKNLENFYYKINELKFEKITQITFDIGKDLDSQSKMHSCGMFIFNMPWQVDEKINLYFPKILEALKKSPKGFFSLKNIR
jgi:23S rRNA (adenine2030-N6)-methyltransferase